MMKEAAALAPREKGDTLVITRKMRGDDGYRVFSIRIKQDTFQRINALAKETGRTRNELIGMLLDFGVSHSEVAGA